MSWPTRANTAIRSLALVLGCAACTVQVRELTAPEQVDAGGATPSDQANANAPSDAATTPIGSSTLPSRSGTTSTTSSGTIVIDPPPGRDGWNGPPVSGEFDCNASQYAPASSDAGASAAQADAPMSLSLSLGTGDLTVLVVFDKSGSMGTLWGAKARWQAASDSLLESIRGIEDQLTIGAILFPWRDQCQVPDAEGAQGGGRIPFIAGGDFVRYWLGTACHHQPDGGTPLGAALASADQVISRWRAEGRLTPRFRVVVVTDGEPNCGTNMADLINLPQKWHELGVETHVLGLPGSEAATILLNDMAAAGGTGTHRAPASEGQLGEVFYALLR